MAIKLRLHLRARPLALFLKALVFVGFLGLMKLSGFSLIAGLFFVLAAFILYASPLRNNLAYLTSFLVLIVIAPVALAAFSGDLWFFAVALISGFLFYVVLGLKHLFFIYRARWHYLLILGLFYLGTLVLFDAAGAGFFLWKLVLVFLTALFLIREFLRITPTDKSPNIRDFTVPRALVAGGSSLLIVETFWVVGLLPLSVLNSVNLSILVIFILLDMVRRYLEATLSRRAIITNVTIFVLLILLILSTSKWSI